MYEFSTIHATKNVEGFFFFLAAPGASNYNIVFSSFRTFATSLLFFFFFFAVVSRRKTQSDKAKKENNGTRQEKPEKKPREQGTIISSDVRQFFFLFRVVRLGKKGDTKVECSL